MATRSGCLMDHYDIRDYSLREAIDVIKQDRFEELEYAIVEYDNKPEKVIDDGNGIFRKLKPVEDESNAFFQYPIKMVFSPLPPPNSQSELSSRAIFVPLKPIKSKQLGVGVREGHLVLVDENNQEVGKLEANNSEIIVVPEDGQDLAAYGIRQTPQNLLLGSGFRQYELEPHHCSPVECQGEPSIPLRECNRYYPDPMCGANAGVALLEYFERASTGTHLNASRLFLHQVACKLMGVEPTSGVSIRAIVKAMTRFGVPPEEYCPYELSKLETKEELSSLCYSYARNYRATSYLSLERPGMDKDALIAQIKIFVYSGLPVIFGFSIYDSIDQSFDNRGRIPFPTYGEIREAGHAAVIVGYDDKKRIKNRNPLSERDRDEGDGLGKVALMQQGDTKALVTKGAFKIRNSWGKEWGEEGYGWLPYAYVTHDYAFDFWAILKFEWMDREDFGPLQQDNNLVICSGYCIKH